MPRIKLGELLVQAGAIDELQLQSALGEQKKWGRPLGRTLVDMRLIDEKTLVAALSRQLNMPAVDLGGVHIPDRVLAYLSKDFCVENSCLPFRHTSRGNFLDVAMADPANPELFDRIRVITRCNVRPHLAGPLVLEAALRRHYLRESGLEAPPSADSGRAWAAGRPDENLFDLAGKGSIRPGEMRVTAPTERLDLEVQVLTRPTPGEGIAPIGRQSPEPEPPGAVAKLSVKVERLASQISDLTALLDRDERVIRRLMALLVDKGICSRQELLARINKE